VGMLGAVGRDSWLLIGQSGVPT